jgi:uncharacterized protein YjiS (DUF1127 family)
MLHEVPASTAAGKGEFLFDIGRSLLRGVAGLIAAARSRKHVVYMRDFDDAQLADIGLKRSDVENALQLPFAADPSLYLVRMRDNPLCRVKRF